MRGTRIQTARCACGVWRSVVGVEHCFRERYMNLLGKLLSHLESGPTDPTGSPSDLMASPSTAPATTIQNPGGEGPQSSSSSSGPPLPPVKTLTGAQAKALLDRVVDGETLTEKEARDLTAFVAGVIQAAMQAAAKANDLVRFLVILCRRQGGSVLLRPAELKNTAGEQSLTVRQQPEGLLLRAEAPPLRVVVAAGVPTP